MSFGGADVTTVTIRAFSQDLAKILQKLRNAFRCERTLHPSPDVLMRLYTKMATSTNLICTELQGALR